MHSDNKELDDLLDSFPALEADWKAISAKREAAMSAIADLLAERDFYRSPLAVTANFKRFSHRSLDHAKLALERPDIIKAYTTTEQFTLFWIK
jgi:hypothetical protein